MKSKPPISLSGSPGLGGLPPDDEAVVATMHCQEINDLRIEKLSNRMTIMSVIIPCLIGAILFFAYLDIKDRVTSVHDSGQTEVKNVSEDLESKLNAMNVELAKVQHTLEVTLPDLVKTVNTVEAKFARLADAKADKAVMDTALQSIENKLAKTVDQYNETIHIVDRTNQETLTLISQTESGLKDRLAMVEEHVETTSKEISGEMKAVGQELAKVSEAFNARMETMAKTFSDYDLEIGTLRKDISLMKKLTDDLAETAIDRLSLDAALESLKTQLENRMASPGPRSGESRERSVKVPVSDLKPKAVPGVTPPEPDVSGKPQPIIENTLTR
ncbi:MAG: hypothetical protein V1793_22210 [Pseudomonadota bacterium]